MGVLGLKVLDFLKYRNSIFGLLQLNQARGVLCKGTSLRADELLADAKMLHRSSAVMLFVSDDAKHRMARGIFRAKLDDSIQQRHSAAAPCFVFEFSGSFESGKVVRRDIECAVISAQGFLVAS